MVEPWLHIYNAMSNDLVAVWDVPLHDGVHTVEFEHGTLTGRRTIRVDGQEVLRKDWMFKLVGDESFSIQKTNCMIRIEPQGLFNYAYSLIVDGQTLSSFTKNQSKICSTWLVSLPPDGMYRVTLQKDTLDVWSNGNQLEVTSDFVDNGTEMHFKLGNQPACIKSVPSYNKREGIIYSLIIDDNIIEPST